MTGIKIGRGHTGIRLLCAGLVVFSVAALSGCGGAEAQKPAPVAPTGQVPGGGDPKEYEKKMKEIMGSQKTHDGGAAPGAGGPTAAPK